MRKVWGRIAAAAILSLSVYGLTQYFAEQYRPAHRNDQTELPIAFIKDINNEVEKRIVTSLVWKGVAQGEPLHFGEALKTSDQGEVRIQFTEGSRYIDLDPETLIVLTKENGNEISLELLGGSFMVSQKDENTAGPALTLKSDEGKVDLSQATAQISKSENKKMDVQVLKGKAKVKKDGKDHEIAANQQLSGLEIISPRLGQTAYVNPSAKESVLFQWKGFPDKTLVSLWIGKNRKSLSETAKTDKASANSLNSQLAAGNYFWQLQAHDEATGKVVQESSVFRLKVENRYPPTLIQPAHLSRVLEVPVTFKWSRPESAQSVLVEISKDSALKEKIISKPFTDKEVLREDLPPGTYYWRLSAAFKEMQAVVESPVYTFHVGPEQEPEKPKLALTISWLSPSAGEPQYFIGTPKAKLHWATSLPQEVHSYRLKLADNEENFKDQTPLFEKELLATQVEAQLPKPGRYLAMVEALDAKNQVMASSEIRNFEVAPLPILKAPEFEPLTGDFKSDDKGSVKLQWTPVAGAKEYFFTVLDSQGAEVRKIKTEKTSSALLNLLPGAYRLNIMAVDAYGRKSEMNPPRNLQVPEGSGLQAPKVKKIEVE